TERTGAEVQSALQEMRARGMRKLVLDLRDNPGGLLESALDVASQFLRDGVIMYEVRRGGEEKSYPVRQGGTAGDIPMVVLVNGGTASAAEIVAGALHDHQRAQLLGEKTYGKGSVQLVFDLSDGSSIHITVARWLRPSRTPIDGAGIEPDRLVVPTEEQRQQDVDALLNAGVTALIAQVP
ncbi:MAG: S41 family peptidase, partial [Anaerolineae bacterium]